MNSLQDSEQEGILEMLSKSSSYEQFQEFLKEKYPDLTFSEKEKLDKFENIFLMGLRQAKDFLKQKKSCKLLCKGKKPRIDKILRLGNILWELQKVPSFPIVPPSRLQTAIKKVIVSGDKRYMNEYRDWIMGLSNLEASLNKLDLTALVNEFPKEKIIECKW